MESIRQRQKITDGSLFPEKADTTDVENKKFNIQTNIRVLKMTINAQKVNQNIIRI